MTGHMSRDRYEALRLLAEQTRELDQAFDLDWPGDDPGAPDNYVEYDECRADLNERLAEAAMRFVALLSDEPMPLPAEHPAVSATPLADEG